MFNKNIHTTLYFVGLSIIALFMPLSEYVTNATQIFIITNWLLELDFKNKIRKLWENKNIIIFILLFIIPVIWLINTDNMNYALSDIRIKLPLLALPIIIGTSEALAEKRINIILISFVSGVFISTLFGILAYNHIIIDVDTDNVRNLSIFVSHIRLSLMLCLSILIICYWSYHRTFRRKIFLVISAVLILWFIYFLSLIQGFTGIVSLIVVSFVVLMRLAFRTKNTKLKILYLSLLILAPMMIIAYLGLQVRNFYNPTQKQEIGEKTHTSRGNLYWNDYDSRLIENGNLIYRNISGIELEEEWPKRSDFDLNGYDKKGQEIFHTLIRYLTSKGLTKDADGLGSLSDQDIRNIENGEANYKFASTKSLNQRIYITIWQLDVYIKGGNPSGHSITQRIEYQKVGLELFKRNLLFGTGTGDVDDEFKALYDELKSPLSNEYRHRTHNQFLTFFISFGIIGGTICLFAWFYPAITGWDSKNYFFLIFFLIATISMITDDTLETTTGVVFCSYFYSLFLWGKK